MSTKETKSLYNAGIEYLINWAGFHLDRSWDLVFIGPHHFRLTVSNRDTSVSEMIIPADIYQARFDIFLEKVIHLTTKLE